MADWHPVKGLIMSQFAASVQGGSLDRTVWRREVIGYEELFIALSPRGSLWTRPKRTTPSLHGYLRRAIVISARRALGRIQRLSGIPKFVPDRPSD
jgi:hypothetical protein